MNTGFEWVDTDVRLAELVCQWQQQDFITLDTEFVRTRTFYPLIGLLQVADEHGCYLIDPLVVKDITPVKQLLEDPNTIKVLHACSEDAEIFNHFYQSNPVAVFDTQVAAGILDIGVSIGYANLVNDQLNIDLPKEETRSNWLQRPLSENQCEYAAKDVTYLYKIYQQLLVLLKATGRTNWVGEDTQRIISASVPLDKNLYYQKIRQGWQLRGEKLWLLRELAAWRETRVKEMDIPRSRLLKDNTLFEIAQTRPNSLYKLRNIREIPSHAVNRNGNVIIDLVLKSFGIPKAEYPDRITGPIKKDASYLVVSAKEFLANLAIELELPLAVITKKKDLEKLIVSGMYNGNFELPDYYHGWRHQRVGIPLVEHLKKIHQSELKSNVT